MRPLLIGLLAIACGTANEPIVPPVATPVPQQAPVTAEGDAIAHHITFQNAHKHYIDISTTIQNPVLRS